MSATDTTANAAGHAAELEADRGPAEGGAEPRDQSERPARDAPPRKRAKRRASSSSSSAGAKPRGAVLKQQSQRLEAKLAELLTFPAMPAAMFAPDPATQGYMIEHFTRSGPRTAAALVEASETNEQLRALLERVTTGGSMFTVVLALAAYVAPPVMWTLGMHQQAALVTRASTLSEQDLAAMMAAADATAQENAAAAAAAAQAAQQQGADYAAPAEPGAGEGDGQPPA